jgi:uncharacterized protein (TIGR02413 family)
MVSLRYFCAFFTAGESLCGFLCYVVLKEVIGMTLNILFFTITIRKRETTIEEALHNEHVQRIYEENKRKVAYFTSL